MNNLLFIFLGGGLGSLCRYGLSLWFKSLEISQLPLATLTSNVISTSILGLIIWKIADFGQAWMLPFFAIGFCGAFSTFSTFSLENFELLKSGQVLWAVFNVIASVLLCFFVLFVLHKALR